MFEAYGQAADLDMALEVCLRLCRSLATISPSTSQTKSPPLSPTPHAFKSQNEPSEITKVGRRMHAM